MKERLDSSIVSRQVLCSDLSIHILECGDPTRPTLLLLHGFPELAFSWRKVLPLLAQAGYYVVAPDVRGYGQTAFTDGRSPPQYEDGLEGYGMLDVLGDIVQLMHKIHEQHKKRLSVEAVIGHDMGSAIAANLALTRPDIFKSLIMMSAPFTGPPSPPSSTSSATTDAKKRAIQGFAKLDPPRKHYQLYFAGPESDRDWMQGKMGLKEMYRGYYYYKSALHQDNTPHSLGDAWDADKMKVLPEYYLMPAHLGMSETVLRNVPSTEEMKEEMTWMPDEDLDIYVQEYSRTRFQAGLNHYRARLSGLDTKQLSLTSGQKISVPSTFISGACDWGNHQDPGALDKMQSIQVVETGQFKGCVFIPGAGHWLQQEQPEKTVDAILAFLEDCLWSP